MRHYPRRLEMENDPRDALARARAERQRQRRRRRSKAIQLQRRRETERRAYLLAQVEPSETVVADGREALVTSRRILFAWRIGLPPQPRGWTHDALTFEEITGWAMGRKHDQRPLLRLQHPPHVRVEQVIAHRFLWARWGNAERPVTHEKTTFSFSRRRDPVFRAITGRLELTRAMQGEPFAEAAPGAREERLGRRVPRGVLYGDDGHFRALTQPSAPARLPGRAPSPRADHVVDPRGELAPVRRAGLVHQRMASVASDSLGGGRLDRGLAMVLAPGAPPPCDPSRRLLVDEASLSGQLRLDPGSLSTRAEPGVVGRDSQPVTQREGLEPCR